MALTENAEMANDQHIATTVAFGHTDKKLYEDAAHKTEFDHDELLRLLLLNRILVFATDTYSTVTSFKDASSTLTVNVGETAYTNAKKA